MRFDCHIHVDVVAATACVKYLFKNVHKGEDYAKPRIQGITDEIELYRKTRYISAAEATWRLLGFQMVDRNPAVTKIHAHLEGEQYVCFQLPQHKLNACKSPTVPTHPSRTILHGLLMNVLTTSLFLTIMNSTPFPLHKKTPLQ